MYYEAGSTYETSETGDSPGGGGDECSEGCSIFYQGDDYCDDACNNEACNFDGGDCAEPTVLSMAGIGVVRAKNGKSESAADATATTETPASATPPVSATAASAASGNAPANEQQKAASVAQEQQAASTTTALRGDQQEAAEATTPTALKVSTTKPMQAMQDLGVTPDEDAWDEDAPENSILGVEGLTGAEATGSSAVKLVTAVGLVGVAGMAIFMFRSFSARSTAGGQRGGARNRRSKGYSTPAHEAQSISSAQDDQGDDDFI
jgi:hypothetical protein